MLTKPQVCYRPAKLKKKKFPTLKKSVQKRRKKKKHKIRNMHLKLLKHYIINVSQVLCSKTPKPMSLHLSCHIQGEKTCLKM